MKIIKVTHDGFNVDLSRNEVERIQDLLQLDKLVIGKSYNIVEVFKNGVSDYEPVHSYKHV